MRGRAAAEVKFQSTSIIADGRRDDLGKALETIIKFQSTSIIADGRRHAPASGITVTLKVSIHVHHC